MRKRSSKQSKQPRKGKPADQAAAELAPVSNGKNPAAVALGRLGGKKGGPARAAKLSKRQLSAIARKAAKARWGKKKRS